MSFCEYLRSAVVLNVCSAVRVCQRGGGVTYWSGVTRGCVLLCVLPYQLRAGRTTAEHASSIPRTYDIKEDFVYHVSGIWTYVMHFWYLQALHCFLSRWVTLHCWPVLHVGSSSRWVFRLGRGCLGTCWGACTAGCSRGNVSTVLFCNVRWSNVFRCKEYIFFLVWSIVLDLIRSIQIYSYCV